MSEEDKAKIKEAILNAKSLEEVEILQLYPVQTQ